MKFLFTLIQFDWINLREINRIEEIMIFIIFISGELKFETIERSSNEETLDGFEKIF